MEKKMLTVEELKEIASGTETCKRHKSATLELCANYKALIRAEMTLADAQRYGIKVVKDKPF